MLRYRIHDRPPRRRRRAHLILFGCLALSAYFAHHVIHGKHGLATRAKLVQRGDVLAIEIASLDAVRAALERDVLLLRPEKPDADFVDEIARDVLGFVRPGDRMIGIPGQPWTVASSPSSQKQ